MNPDDPTVFPKRWKYPTDEQVKNPVNYKKAIDDQYGGYDGQRADVSGLEYLTQHRDYGLRVCS